MNKLCTVCEQPFKDGELVYVVAAVHYKEIPSRVHFAVSMPEEIIDVWHERCCESLKSE